jgi:DNA-directed RNA polymerase specialized sigma24 family protein
VDERDLVRAAVDGDVDAFTALVDSCRPSVMRVAYAIADGEADEVAHDAVTKAYRRLSTFRSERSFRREALVLKAASRRVEPGDDPADELARNERRQTLLDAVARLSDRDREIVSLRYFCELSEAETAAAIGIAPGTVKSRLSRALVRLRDELGEDDR